MPSSGISLRQHRPHSSSQGQGQGQGLSPVDVAWAKASRRVEEVGERMTSLLQVGVREAREDPPPSSRGGREGLGGESEGGDTHSSFSPSSLSPSPSPSSTPSARAIGGHTAAAPSARESQREASGRHWFSTGSASVGGASASASAPPPSPSPSGSTRSFRARSARLGQGLRQASKGEGGRERGREGEGGAATESGGFHLGDANRRGTGPDASAPSPHSPLTNNHRPPGAPSSPSPSPSPSPSQGHPHGRHTAGLRDGSSWRCPLDVSVQQQCARSILQFAEAVADNAEILFLMHGLPSRARFLRQLQTYVTGAVAALASLLDSAVPTVVWSAARASCLLSQGRLGDLWCTAAPAGILLPLACLLDSPSDQVVCDAAVTMTATLSKMRPATQSRFTVPSSYSTKDLSSGVASFPRNVAGGTGTVSNSTTDSTNGTTTSSGATTGLNTSSSGSSSSGAGRGSRGGEGGEGVSAKDGRSTAALAQLVGRALGAPGAALPCPPSTPLVRLCPLSVQSSLWLALQEESQMMNRILGRLKGLAGIQEVVTPAEGERKGLLWMPLPLPLRGRKGGTGSSSSSSGGGGGGGGAGSVGPAWGDSVTLQTMAVKTLRLLLSVGHIWREQARESFEGRIRDWGEAFRALCTHRSCYISTAAMSALSGALVCCPALGRALLEDASEGALWGGVVRHVLHNKCPAAVAAAASLVTRLAAVPSFCRVLTSADTTALAGALVPLMSASRCPAEISAHAVPSLSAPPSSLLASLSSFGCTHTGPTRATIIAHESFPFPPMPANTASSSFSTNQAALQAVVSLLRWPGAHHRTFLMHSLAHSLHGKLAHGWQSASGAKESGKEAGERRELIWSAVEWIARFSGGQQCLEDGTLSPPSGPGAKRLKAQKNKGKASGAPGAPPGPGAAGAGGALSEGTAPFLEGPLSGAHGASGFASLASGQGVHNSLLLGGSSKEAVPHPESSGRGARGGRGEEGLGRGGGGGGEAGEEAMKGGSCGQEDGSAPPDLFERSLTRLINATCAAFLGLFCGHVPSASYALRTLNLRDNLRHALSSHEGYCLARATLALVQAPDRAMAHRACSALQNLLLTSTDGRLWKWHVPDVKGSASWQMQDSWEQAARLAAVAALAEVEGFREELVLLGLARGAWEVAQEASPGKTEEETLERLLMDALVSPRHTTGTPLHPPPTPSNSTVNLSTPSTSTSQPQSHATFNSSAPTKGTNAGVAPLGVPPLWGAPGCTGGVVGSGVPGVPTQGGAELGAATFFASSVDAWEGKDKVLLASLQALESLLRAHQWCAAQKLVEPLLGPSQAPSPPSRGPHHAEGALGGRLPQGWALLGSHTQQLGYSGSGAGQNATALAPWLQPAKWGAGTGNGTGTGIGTGAPRETTAPVPVQCLTELAWHLREGESGPPPGIRWCAALCLANFGVYGLSSAVCASLLPYSPGPAGGGDDTFADVTFSFRDGQQLSAHGAVIAARCPELLPKGLKGNNDNSSNSTNRAEGQDRGLNSTTNGTCRAQSGGVSAGTGEGGGVSGEEGAGSWEALGGWGPSEGSASPGPGCTKGAPQIGYTKGAPHVVPMSSEVDSAEYTKGASQNGHTKGAPHVVPMSSEVDSAAFGAIMDFVYTGAAHVAPGLEPAVARLASRCRLPVLASLVLREAPTWGAALPVCNLWRATQFPGTLWSDYGVMSVAYNAWDEHMEGEEAEDSIGGTTTEMDRSGLSPNSNASPHGSASPDRCVVPEACRAAAEEGDTLPRGDCVQTESGESAPGGECGVAEGACGATREVGNVEGGGQGAQGVRGAPPLGEVEGPLGGVRRVHRVVLAARCEYLRGLLCSGMRESSTDALSLPLPPPAVSGLVAYLYMGSGAVRQVMLNAVLQEQKQLCRAGTAGTCTTVASLSCHSVSPAATTPVTAKEHRRGPAEASAAAAQAQGQLQSQVGPQGEGATEALILSAIALAGIAQQWMLPGLLHECASIVFETVSMETAVGAAQAAWDESVGIIVEGLAALLAPHYLKLQYSGKLASVHDQLADLLRSTFVESKVL